MPKFIITRVSYLIDGDEDITAREIEAMLNREEIDSNARWDVKEVKKGKKLMDNKQGTFNSCIRPIQLEEIKPRLFEHYQDYFKRVAQEINRVVEEINTKVIKNLKEIKNEGQTKKTKK